MTLDNKASHQIMPEMSQPEPWTADEQKAVLEVRAVLVEKGVPNQALGEKELITITANSKWRVDESVKKFMTYRDDLLQAFGVKVPTCHHLLVCPGPSLAIRSRQDVWGDAADLGDQWHRLAVAGRDDGDRGIMWINGGGTPEDQEEKCIRSCTLYFFAVHADRRTLREGCSMIIDTSNSPKKKVGNEKRLQVAWQNFPTRPQHIFILGTSIVTRVIVNGLIAFASLFAKNKVIARIEFLKRPAKVGELFGESALPEIHGGPERAPTAEWVKARLAAFPLMGLPPLEDKI